MYAIILIMDMCVTDSCAVYRVNWLRAKARFNRWEEETKMVKNEMTWTTLWFENQRKRWQDRAEKCEEKQQRGHACYAWKQVEMWKAFQLEAESTFGSDMVIY
jgi:hypothetical protein